MANGIYAAAAGIAAQQTRINAISNDLANADTSGFKSERIGFADLLYGSEGGVAVGSGAMAIDAGPTTTQGTFGASSNPLSVAISGSGYIQVRRGDGTLALTRDGDLQLDASGGIVTSTGEQLNPPIKLPKGTQLGDVKIYANGTVSAGNQTVGKIQLVDVGAPAGLQSVGSSLFVANVASGPATPATSTTLVQNQLEQSNVNVAASMTELLDAQQNYTMLSHAIQTQDQLLQIANQLRG
jgi:flagellar basal-body rod protein FlgG